MEFLVCGGMDPAFALIQFLRKMRNAFCAIYPYQDASI
jgi:hypothetical protein